MNIITKQGSLDNNITYEHYCDTKADLANIPKDQITLGTVAIVLKDEGNEMALKYGIKYIETSAKDTVNIEELSVDTAKNLMAKQQSAKTGNNNIGQNSFGIDLTNTGSNSSEDNKGSIQGSGSQCH